MHAMNLNANAKCIAHTILIKTRLRLLNAMPRRKKIKQLTKGKTIGIVIQKSLATPVNQKQLRALPT